MVTTVGLDVVEEERPEDGRKAEDILEEAVAGIRVWLVRISNHSAIHQYSKGNIMKKEWFHTLSLRTRRRGP